MFTSLAPRAFRPQPPAGLWMEVHSPISSASKAQQYHGDLLHLDGVAIRLMSLARYLLGMKTPFLLKALSLSVRMQFSIK